VSVDQTVVAGDFRMLGGDETGSLPVNSLVVNLFDIPANGQQTILELPQIQDLEFVGVSGFAFRVLQVYPSNRIALPS
jgi:hypothetical protein